MQIWGKEVHPGIWWENLKARDHFENPDVEGRVIFKDIG